MSCFSLELNFFRIRMKRLPKNLSPAPPKKWMDDDIKTHEKNKSWQKKERQKQCKIKQMSQLHLYSWFSSTSIHTIFHLYHSYCHSSTNHSCYTVIDVKLKSAGKDACVVGRLQSWFSGEVCVLTKNCQAYRRTLLPGNEIYQSVTSCFNLVILLIDISKYNLTKTDYVIVFKWARNIHLFGIFNIFICVNNVKIMFLCSDWKTIFYFVMQ